jgi:L-2-hydroxyglutarate oxidase
VAEGLDVAIIGGGIVGLATALALTDEGRDTSVVVLEKEPTFGSHQSSRNSGVIHAGVYYKPGSLKAELCQSGRRLMMAFCDEHQVTYEICGKVIVATSDDELPRLDELARRAAGNGVAVRRMDPAELHELEPHASGVAALHVPSTGVVSYAAVVDAMADELRRRGVELRASWPVQEAREVADGVELVSTAGTMRAGRAVNCGGLHADRLTGEDERSTYIAPFRGEYYELMPERRFLCRTLIYPVPDPAFPFLGVHLTRGIDGGVHVGPNAVPALAREGYRWRDVSPHDVGDLLRRRGTWRLYRRHWRMGAGEIWRSMSKPAFAKAVQRLCPDVRSEDLVRAPAGVRAQALTSDGALVDDFAFVRTERILHVVNSPSPAATASLAIGRHIAQQLDAQR